MKDSPVVPCCVVGTTVPVSLTTDCQSTVPGGINATFAVLLFPVKAPAIKTESPGPSSLEIQKMVLLLYVGVPINWVE